MLIIVIIFVIACYLFMLKPNRVKSERVKKLKPFINRYVAHRGLYMLNDESIENYPENSLPAFARAVKYKYAIELDVRLTKDNKLVVFHDKNIKRMCGVNGRVSELTYEELQCYGLNGTKYKIPEFKNVLKEINGKTPLLIEIKADRHTILTTKILLKQLDNYHGDYIVESFSPLALIFLRMKAPEIIRGKLVQDNVKGYKINAVFDILLNGMLLNFLSKPDFIASNHKYIKKIKYRLMRRIYNYTAAGWTIKNQKELENAKKYFQIIIFDSFAAK